MTVERRSSAERLLTLEEFARLTSTTERLARRLIAERRIRYVKVGKYVRIPESAVTEYVAANTIQPSTTVSDVAAGRPHPRRATAQRPVRMLPR